MTLNDIPERFRNDPNLILHDKPIHMKLSEKTCEDLAFVTELEDKKESA